jgi:hypothetical protein
MFNHNMEHSSLSPWLLMTSSPVTTIIVVVNIDVFAAVALSVVVSGVGLLCPSFFFPSCFHGSHLLSLPSLDVNELSHGGWL